MSKGPVAERAGTPAGPRARGQSWGTTASLTGVTTAADEISRVTSTTGHLVIAAEETGASRLAGSIRDVNPTGGKLNCVNCAVATDSTLAGAPASALPGGVSDVGNRERFYGRSFKPVSGQGEIGQMLSYAGPGARGIVFGGRAASYGHVFNGVNQGGTIRFLDGQSGGLANWEDGFDRFFFMRTN
jgi:hypothetical protein